MKTSIVFIVLVILTYNVHGQNWLQLNHIGSVRLDHLDSFCMDGNGDYYISLNYSGAGSEPCYFDGQPVTNVNASTSYFMAKFSNAGVKQWSKVTYSSAYNAMLFDSATNSIVMTRKLMLQSEACDSVHNFGGASDILVAKMALNGNCIWNKNFGSAGDDAGMRIASDYSGNIYLFGSNSSVAYFDTISVAPGYFLAKLDSSGNVLWAKKMFDIFSQTNIGVMKCFKNDLFMYGNCEDDTLKTDTFSIVNSPKPSSVIGRMDSAGNYKWIKLIDKGTGGGSAMDMDNKGNIYMGDYLGTEGGIFDNDTIYSTPNSIQATLCKMDIDGSILWIKKTDSPTATNTITLRLNIDKDQNVYITGNLQGTSNFDNLTLTASFQNMFIVRYDSSGNVIGGKTSVSGSSEGIFLESDNSNNILVAGYFTQSFELTPLSPLTSIGSHDLFIAKSSAITGITDPTRLANNKLIIYANPMQGKCNVTVPDDFLHEKNLLLMIYDNNGKMIQQRSLEMSADKIKLSLNQEAKGIYNVTLSNGSKIYSGRIVFE
jgi:hypothetical protein